MPADVTVTRVDDKNFHVTFAQAVPGPAGSAAGQPVPVEWLRAALDYYLHHRDAEGSLKAPARPW